MKLKEFIESLNEIVKENPNSLEMEVICSADDEGNHFNRVYYSPTIGRYNSDGEFESDTILKPNAICIN